MTRFTPLMPHGTLEEIFPDVFFVTGTSRPFFEGEAWQYSRNMTVVRDEQALTLINSVRLDEAGLQALEKLGKVRNIVKLGAMHGIDDAFYVDRYGAKLWALAGMEHEAGIKTDVELLAGGPMPIAQCSLFVFETSAMPEGVLLIEREGGMLVACDSLQNWEQPDRFFDEKSMAKMREFGFFKQANVGPGWRRYCNPQKEDFVRLKSLSFRHLLSAHGKPLKDQAYEKLAETLKQQFAV